MTDKIKIFYLISVVLFILTFLFIIDTVREGEDNLKSFVGKTIIIKKDTLTVVDYSMLQNNLTLSNGATISYEYAKNLIEKY